MQSQDDKISPRFGPFETTQVPQASISHSQSFANYTNPQPNYNLQPQTFPQYSQIPDQEQNQKKSSDNLKPKIIAEKPKRANSRLTFKRTLSNLVDFKHPGPKAACVAFTTVMAITPVMIALMVYHFGDKDVKLTSVSGGLDYIVFNLNSDPIMDITTSPSSLVCPQGAEAVKLGKWSGTGAGCDCATGLTLGLCSDKEKLIFCSEVNPINPIDMYKWEDSAICAKRAQLGVNYVKAEVCPSGYKRCSPGICMENSQNCPITKVTIDSGSDPNLRLGATSNYLVLERLVDKTPVIDFDISPNSLPCFSSTEIPGPKGNYLLLHEGPKGCQRYGEDTDFSYQINKDPTTQKDVFTTNSFPDSVFKLPGYSKVISETPTLLSGRYRLSVATKAECLGMDTATILQASEAAGRLNRFMTATAITAMVLHSLLFLFLFIVLISFKKRHTLKEIVMGKEVTFWAPAYIYLGFAECIVFIVMVALVRSSVSDMSKAQQYLSDLNELACFSSGAPQLVIADYDIIVNEVAARLSGFAISLMIASLISYVPFVGILSRKHHLWKMQNRKTFSY